MLTVLLALGVFYLVLILLVWAQHRIPVEQVYSRHDPATLPLPPALSQSIDDVSADLTAAGFVRRAPVIHERPNGTVAFALLHEGPGGQTSAAVIVALRRGRSVHGRPLINFVTAYADGGRRTTNNAPYNHPMRVDRRDRLMQFRSVTHAGELLRLHAALVASDGRPVMTRHIPEDPSALFGQLVSEDMKQQVALGSVRPLAHGAAYRFTVMGAMRMVYRTVPPAAWLVTAWNGWRSRRLRTKLSTITGSAC